MPNVVITADYSALQKATEAAKNLDAVLNGISHKRLDLTAQLRDAQSELERLALKLRQTNDEIARQRNQGKTRTDMTSLYEDQARQRSQVTAQKGVIDNLKAQDRILANQADHWKKQLNYQNDIIKTQNQAIREQEQAQAKADREAAAALAKRQEAAQKTEKSFADLQKSEVDRARAAAIDAGRSDPRTEEEWAAAFERRTQREAEAAEVERQLAEAEKERQAAADRAAEEERIRQMEEERQAALDLAAAISAVGDAFNTLGSISGGIADFSTGIANSFRSMASMFSDANVTDSLKRLAMQYFTDTFAGDLSSAISRYDILSTFVPYMQAAGVDEQTANTSLARVNESIIGIPIGLDEAAQRLRRYQMFLGDVESATNLTIGAQNAIIAGGASEQMKNMAYMQIDRLLAAGKLNTSRQWLSLIQGLGVSMNYVSQAMGTTNMTPKELAAGLTSGEISTESFLEALMELGKGESDAAAGLNNLLTIYKGTIEAWQASIRYASTRGQANVIDVLSDSLETLTGQGVTGYMKDYRDFINEVYGGIGSFISNNPELITTSLEKFNQLIDSVSKFSASEFAMNVFSRLGEGVDLISRALEHIPAGKLEEFAAFATTLAGPIGSGMLAANGLGQILGVFERFKTYDFGNLIDSIARNVGSMASAVELLLGVLPDGLMTELMAFGLVWGKPLATVLTSVGGALNSLGATLKSIAGVSTLSGAFLEGGVFGWLLQLAKMHPQLAAVATGLTAIAGAMALFASAERQSVRQLSEDLGITDFVNEMKQIQSAMDSLDIRIGVREEDLAQTETAIRQAERLREALLELDSADGEDFNAAKLAATAKELEAVLPGVDASIDATTGHLTEQARAALEDADAFEQLIAKMREAAAAAALQGAMTDLYTAEYQRDVANEAVTTAERNLRLAEYGLQRARERAYKGQWAVTPDEGPSWRRPPRLPTARPATPSAWTRTASPCSRSAPRA